MRVLFVLFADAANHTVEGKLNISGEYNSIIAPQLPAIVVSTLSIIRLELQKGEKRKHTATFDLVSPEPATVLARMTQDFTIPASRTPLLPERINLISTLQGLILPSYGRYELRVSIDGKLLDVAPLAVIPKQLGP